MVEREPYVDYDRMFSDLTASITHLPNSNICTVHFCPKGDGISHTQLSGGSE